MPASHYSRDQNLHGPQHGNTVARIVFFQAIMFAFPHGEKEGAGLDGWQAASSWGPAGPMGGTRLPCTAEVLTSLCVGGMVRSREVLG